ncbi:MAG: hypothetical protein AAGJ70_09065 [Pseudomonadota bacterium]
MSQKNPVIAVVGLALTPGEDLPQADAILLAVAHNDDLDGGPGQLLERLKPGGLIADVKSKLDAAALEAGGAHVWRL